MASRGLWHYMSARTRRGLALSWSALFVLSLLLQYFSFAVAAQPALAAHNEGIFELDGNALDQAAAGADWQNGAEGSADQFFVGASGEDPANDVGYFTTGGSKDENDIPKWEITDNSVPDKNELLDAYAAVYQSGGDTWVYFGADRFDNDGDAQIGFWFFQNNIGIANGDFTGVHADGDVLILSEYTNGGVVDLVCAYEWDGSGGGSNIANPGSCDPATAGSNLNLVAAGAACDTADGTYNICAVTNAAVSTAPWPFTNKDGAHDFGVGQFFEGGINLSDMFGGQPPCFGTFLAETRSSQETDAQLKDFALGSLSTCVPPTIATQVDDATADFGQQVTDTATLSGSQGPVTGTVSFFICTPAQITAAGCPTGGTQVGGAVTIVAGSATSAAYTVGLTAAAAGTYCWRAEYTPAASSDYLAATHTNNS
ncbi:MAG TPA: Ig-like domain-containing protein, partial [Candidatus Limnocylindrales bacterium]|nr:Ig-like domain-containing protein [Candidatus Limnocylindrales bacterium]